MSTQSKVTFSRLLRLMPIHVHEENMSFYLIDKH